MISKIDRSDFDDFVRSISSTNFGMNFLNYLIIFLCILGRNFVFSLYEDQIGKFDWRLQLIGKPIHVVFDPSATSEKSGSMRRVYAITEQNVLAALNWNTGEIVWRHVFEQGESGHLDGLLLTNSGEILTLSGGGQQLMLWERHRGSLRWSVSVSNEYCKSSKLAEFKNGNLAVLCNGILSAFDRTGSPSGTVNLQKHIGTESIQWHDAIPSGGELIVLGENTKTSSAIAVLVSPTGTIINTVEKNVKYDPNRVKILSNPSRLVWFDSNAATVNTLVLSGDSASSTESRSASVTGHKSSNVRLASAGDHFALIDGERVSIAIKSGDQYKMETVEGATIGFMNTQDNSYAAVASVSARGGFSVRFYDLKSGKSNNDWDLVVPSTDVLSSPELIFPFFQLKTDRSTQIAGIMVVGADHSLALINHPGKIAWSRQEALASILSVEMLDLPLSEAQENIEEEFSTNGTILHMFVRRVTLQAIQLQRVLFNAVNEIFGLADLLGKSDNIVASLASVGGGGGRSGERGVAEKTAASSKGQRLERDYFNLHKIMVLVTAAGKVYGMDNYRGAIIWQKYLPDVSPFVTLQKPVLPLYVLRTTAHYPFPAQCAVVGRNKAGGNGLIVTFSPITGAEFQRFPLHRPVKQSVILPAVDEHEQQAIGIITDDLKTYVFPASAAQAFSTSLEQKPFVVFLADGAGSLSGYRVIDSSANKETSEKEKTFAAFDLDPQWKTTFPLEKQGKLVGAAMKRFTEQVHTQGRALGDRSVLYKYVNPNLVAAIADSIDSTGKNQMNIYLVDAVTGDIIFNAVHRRVNGPYHFVHCENWIVYTYWNEKARRNEIAVLELYEGKEQADSSKFSSLNPPNPPIVMRQAYVFPQGISALAVTDTEKGITSRHLLISMPFGGILELSKAFLDPRRVLTPTMEQREEGLYPYIPDLPIVTEQIINYNQTVANIREIHTTPSGLESTSLALAYGLDLYFTRVTPSGTFDILKDDFDHWLIACVLLGLFLSSAIAKRLARHRDVKLAWK